MNSPIYKDFYYTADTASLEYYIVADDMIIFRGKVWRNPDTGIVTVHVGDIIRDYLRFDLPDFRPLDDVVTRQEDAYKIFGLYNASGTKLDEYKVLFDWYGEWNGERKVLSNPIDGILDPRMKILWTIYGPAAMDVIMETGPISIDTYFRLLTTLINASIEGGSYRVRWATDYYPSSEWTVEISGLTGYTYTDANFSGITINLPGNPSMHPKEYEVYYHIHGQTFGVTTIKQEGGEIHVDGEVEIGPFSGDTAPIHWTTNYTGATITCVADDWLEVTDITLSGATIHAKTDNDTLGPRVGSVSVYVDGELVWTVTVTQAGKYFRMISTRLEFSDTGGTLPLLWDTDILTSALSVVIDDTAFTATNISKTGCTVTAGENEDGDSLFSYAKVYSGDTLLGTAVITQAGVDYEARPFTIKMLSGGTLYYRMYVDQNPLPSFSINGGPWKGANDWGYTGNQQGNRTRFISNLNAGDRIEFAFTYAGVYPIGYFGNLNTMPFEAKGNVMSLVYGLNFYGKKEVPRPGVSSGMFQGLLAGSSVVYAHNLILPATSLTYSSYASMFAGCTSLVSPPEELPATMFINTQTGTTTDNSGQYWHMFSGCTSLAYPPKIAATTATISMCEAMFAGCSSMLEVPVLHATSVNTRCYKSMFAGCTSITEAPALIATAVTWSCYEAMFSGCTSLLAAPELPATSVFGEGYIQNGVACYARMFDGCSSMVTGPSALPITQYQFCWPNQNGNGTYCIVTKEIYQYMFRGCSSLITAPAVQLEKIAEESCNGMFQNCRKLKSAVIYSDEIMVNGCDDMFNGCWDLDDITCLATTVAANSTRNWVFVVNYEGTFTKSPNMNSWTRGYDGIPTDWNVTDYIE